MTGLLTWLLMWLQTPPERDQTTKVGGICILHLYIKTCAAVLGGQAGLKTSCANVAGEARLTTTLSSVVPVAAGQSMPVQEA